MARGFLSDNEASRSDLEDIAGEIRFESERTYKFFDGTKEVWLPKSQCEWDKDAKTMAMPRWLAKENGLI